MVLVRKVGAAPRLPPERFEPILKEAKEHLEEAKNKLISAQSSMNAVQTKYDVLQAQVNQIKAVSQGRWPWMRKKNLRRILETFDG